jgi:hypothetical protein
MTEDESRKGADARGKAQERTETGGETEPHNGTPQTWSADHGGGVSPPTSKPVSSKDEA